MKEKKILIALVSIFIALLVALLWTSQRTPDAGQIEGAGEQGIQSKQDLNEAEQQPSVRVFPVQYKEKDLEKLVLRAPILRRDQDRRMIRAMGLDIPLAKVDEAEVGGFAQKISSAIGLAAEELSVSAERVNQEANQSSSGGDLIFRVQQKFAGYDVLEGELRISVDPRRSAVTGIEASQIVHFEGDLTNRPTPRSRIENELAATLRQEFLPVRNAAPKVYLGPDDRPRLVYQFTPRPANAIPPDWKQLVVDAENGRVLTTRNLVIKN